MKKPALLSIFLLSWVVIHSQIAYYSATEIRDNCVVLTGDGFKFKNDEISIEKLSAYLKDFLPESDLNSEMTGDQVLDRFSDNPFFGEQIRQLAGGSSGFMSSLVSNTARSIGGLNVTNIANGISQFMIRRAKEELTIAFFERFQEFAEKNPEFEVLFPKTTSNLKNLLAFKYPEMLPALRTGFFEDIKSTPYHLDDVLELPRYRALLKNLPEVKVAIRTIRLVYELESGNAHAADVLMKFGNFEEWDEVSSSNGFKNFGSAVKLAGIFSNSLRNNDTQVTSQHAWITFTELQKLVSDDIAVRIYLGLIYQMVQNNSIQFFTNQNGQDKKVRFDSLMAEQKDNLFLFKNKLTEFIELANKVDNVRDSIQTGVEISSVSHDKYYDYIDVSLDVIDYALSIGKLFSDHLKIEEYTLIARSANDLYRNIYKQEYTQAITNVVDILQETKDLIDELKITPSDDEIKFVNSLDLKTEIREKNGMDKLKRKQVRYLDAYIVSGKASPDVVQRIQKFTSLYYWNKLEDKLLKISQYGLFMANMANAKSPDEIATILDNVTLPVGSSSIKKNSKFNVSVQSYLGAFVQFDSVDNTSAWNSRFGITAPIGIAFSKGLPKKYGSLSLFVSLLDIGAIVDYQLTSETVINPDGTEQTGVKKNYQIELGQIFSPGTYFVYGFFGNLPISFGIGGQYGPGLGKIDDGNNPIVNNPGWRWNAFLSVDIPLFNLANVSKVSNN